MKFLRVSDERQSAFTLLLIYHGLRGQSAEALLSVSGHEQQAITGRGGNFAAADEEDAAVHSAKRHLRCVDIRRRMLRHHDEIKIVQICCPDNLFKAAVAVSPEHRMNVHHSAIFREGALALRDGALGI